jgi:hypothetical protein
MLSLSVCLGACARPDVRYADLSPATTGTLSAHGLTLYPGSDLKASASYTRLKARVEGQTVYVAGYRTLRQQRRIFSVPLPASTNSRSLEVLWVDPDGSRVPVSLGYTP